MKIMSCPDAAKGLVLLGLLEAEGFHPSLLPGDAIVHPLGPYLLEVPSQEALAATAFLAELGEQKFLTG